MASKSLFGLCSDCKELVETREVPRCGKCGSDAIESLGDSCNCFVCESRAPVRLDYKCQHTRPDGVRCHSTKSSGGVAILRALHHGKGVQCSICMDTTDRCAITAVFPDCGCVQCMPCFKHFAETAVQPSESYCDKGIAYGSLRADGEGYFLPPCPVHPGSFFPPETFKVFPRVWRRMKDLASLRDVLEHGVQCPYEDCGSGGWFVDMRDQRPLHCPDCSRPFCGLCRVAWGSAGCPHSRHREIGEDPVSELRAAVQEAMTLGITQLCPQCGVTTSRISSCVHVTCGNCSASFNWPCGQLSSRCRARKHDCQHPSIFMHNNPRMREEMKRLGRRPTDKMASLTFLELRTTYHLSLLKARFQDERVWKALEAAEPTLFDITTVDHGSGRIALKDIGNIDRLSKIFNCWQLS